MTSKPMITIEVDAAADAAYVTLGDPNLAEPEVARTVEFSPTVAVDLDELDVVVGIELLTLNTDLTHVRVDDLCREHHVPAAFTSMLTTAFQAVTQWVAQNTTIEPPSPARSSDFGAIRPATATLEECPR